MAYDGQQITIPGLLAGADLSAATNQFKFVKLTAAKTIDVCDDPTDLPIGVLQNRPNLNEAAEVVGIGVTKIQGDADLAYGDEIGTSTDGQAAAYTAANTTYFIVGRIIEDQTTAGGLATALISCTRRRLANP